MNAKDDDERSHPVNKKLVDIPLSSSATANDGIESIQRELTIPSASRKPEAPIIFVHGSGSGRDSPRNHQSLR